LGNAVCGAGSEVMELPIAQVQELRGALKKFRESQKTALCHAESFGGASSLTHAHTTLS
jgi:hypothetical protein